MIETTQVALAEIIKGIYLKVNEDLLDPVPETEANFLAGLVIDNRRIKFCTSIDDNYEVRLGSIYEEANDDMVFDFLRGVMKCYGQLVQQSEGIEDDDFNSELEPI